uniref:Uracil phosphoribosyltransferase n=1 Tax=Kumanoa americana TaxID=1196377 RepID=A0A1C9CGP7_9FLOR|nr:uracil phosphoribosyltransferase [Kumanoa americana]AOM67570.1 uracil phosphoribosyltransferase [Kumanoa americana]
MTLSIYTIKHPLVQHWSSYILNVTNAKHEQKNIVSQIFLTLLYESTRKSIKLINLYINHLGYIKEINLICNKRPYLIFSEINLIEILGKNIYKFFPEADILPFQITNFSKSRQTYIEFGDLSNCCQLNPHIIIIEQYLNLDSMSKIVSSIKNTKYAIQEIQVICFICSNEILQIINKTYININLTIYTTKIIENSNAKMQLYLNKIFI